MVTLQSIIEELYEQTPGVKTENLGDEMELGSLIFDGTIEDVEGNKLAEAGSGLSFEAIHDNAQHSENYTTSNEAANAAPVQTVNGNTGDVSLTTGVSSVNGFTGAVALDTGDISRGEFVSVLTDIARIQTQIGLESLGYDTANFEIFADDRDIDTAASTNTALTLGVEVDGNGYAAIQDGQNSATVVSYYVNMNVIPDSLVVVDEMFAPLPSQADATYTITDENGNSVSFSRSEIDTTVSTSGLNTFRLQVSLELSRTSTSVRSPKVDSWSVYASGQTPSGDYFDAEQVGAPARTELYVSDDPTATTDFQIESTTVL